MRMKKRIYDSILADHVHRYRQMAFVMGPRQVGKTTSCRLMGESYLDWDNEDHREIILAGPASVADIAGLNKAAKKRRVLILDEIHKYRHWKKFLKGFFDTYENDVRILVTGSSRLDVYRRGGDSLMGRYFMFRMHPFSVAETVRTRLPESPVSPQLSPAPADWKALLEHGGFPEPFLRRDRRFSLRWQKMRSAQLLREDIRDLTGIRDLDQLSVLVKLLGARSGQQIIYSNLASQIRVSENTVRSWISTLCSLQFGFLVRPWHRNITKAIRKEPKWFLRDWSSISDTGSRAETLVACHLLKAVHAWSDLGFGDFALRYIRDKQKREVDFLVVRDEKPWFLVEAKHHESALGENLAFFQKMTGAAHAFQVVLEEDFVDTDCFGYKRPVAVPARTFLSQLI